MINNDRTVAFNFPAFHRIAGNLFFIVLLIYAIVYAVERVTYIDSAWLFFERVNGEKFSFPGARYSAVFSEIPLFIAAKLHLSLKTLVYVFSISYILLYYFVWRLCTFTFKSPAAGLTLIFGLVIGIREAFLYTVSETHQCFVYSALLIAVMRFDFNGKMALKYFICCFVALMVLFAHPLGVFTAGFVLLYYFVERKQLKDPLIYLVGLITFGFAAFSLFHPANPYDAAQFQRLSTSTGTSSFFDSAALHFFTFHFPHFYWLPELAGIIVIIWLAIKKEWLKLGAVVVSVLAYFVIACVTFKNGDSSIMLERIFLPAFFMINLALADLIFQEKKMKTWMVSLIVVFFLFNGIRYINAGCLMYKKRVAYLDELVQNGIAQGHDTYFLSQAQNDPEKIIVPWALGTETLIYSTFKYNHSISISTTNDICSPGSCRLTSMLCLPVNELNQHYFHLSGEAYQELKNK